MRQDDRAPFDRALHRARVSAYAPGEFVGQESFMTAGEIRALAVQVGVGPGVKVLDLCCGIGGPGRLLTRELGCVYLGLDASASAVAIARDPKVLKQIAPWGWQDGMRPDPQAPVWQMHAFRDRFLTAFGPSPGR